MCRDNSFTLCYRKRAHFKAKRIVYNTVATETALCQQNNSSRVINPDKKASNVGVSKW